MNNTNTDARVDVERFPLWYCRFMRVVAIVMTVVWSHMLFRWAGSSWQQEGMLPMVGLFLLYLFVGFVWLIACVAAFTAESIDEAKSGEGSRA